MMMESKLEVHKDKTLKEATEMAYKVCQFCLVCFWFWIWSYFLLFVSNYFVEEQHRNNNSRCVYMDTNNRTTVQSDLKKQKTKLNLNTAVGNL